MNKFATALLLMISLVGCSASYEEPQPQEEEVSEQKPVSDPVPKAVTPAPTTPTPVAAPAPTSVVQPVAPEPPKPWEAWTYTTSELPMGGVMKVAAIQSSNILQFDFPYQGDQRGWLVSRIREGNKEVIIGIEKGQIICHSYSGCTILIRIDDKPAQEYSASGPEDNSSTLIFVDSDTLADEIAQSSRVRVQLTVYQQGNPVLDFSTAGFKTELWNSDVIGEKR